MLVVGMFAMLLHLLAGTGLVRAGIANDGGFVPQVCSSHGVASPGTQHFPGGGQVSHDCCKLCAAGAPPILSGTTAAVLPAPTFVTRQANLEEVTQGQAPPSANRPRGPPTGA